MLRSSFCRKVVGSRLETLQNTNSFIGVLQGFCKIFTQNTCSTNYIFLKKTLGGFLPRCTFKWQKVDVVHAVIKYSESEEADQVIMKAKDSCRNVQPDKYNIQIQYSRE